MIQKTALIILFSIFCSIITQSSGQAQSQLRIGGYFQSWLILNQMQETADIDYNTWGFRIRRARLTAQADITDKINVTSWIEFSGAQRHLLDFFITARISPALNIRLGQYRPPAQMHDTGIRSSANLLFYERPEISTRLSAHSGFDSFRDIGIQAFGTLGPVWYGVHIGNGMGRFSQAGTNISARDFGGGIYGGRIDITPLSGMTIGGHFSINKQNNVIRDGSSPFDIDRTLYSIRFATDNFIIPNLFTNFEFGGGTYNEQIELDFNGWYFDAGYRITPVLALLARYDVYEETPVNQESLEQQNFTFGFLYYWMLNDREIIRAGVNYGLGKSQPNDLSRNILLLWIQIRFLP